MTEKQEIDLFEIFIYIFRIFKKRKFYILTFFLVGIVFGYLSSYKVNKIYEQTSICEERVVGNEIIGKIINEFNDKLINENTHESFLPLIENEVKLFSITVDTLKDQGLVLHFRGHDQEFITKAKTDLFKYINKILSNKINNEIQNKYELLHLIERNLSKIDSLQKIALYNFGNKSSNLIYFGSIFNHENIELCEKKFKVEETISLIKKEGVISEISCSNKLVVGNRIIKKVLFFSIISFLIGVVILFLVEFFIEVKRKSV